MENEVDSCVSVLVCRWNDGVVEGVAEGRGGGRRGL